ncbi:hypothetical protein C7H09_04055 [Marinobacter fuscus]|uniref:DUF3450 domain-containing protein n=1 Tax=Marinobacter fuscus TaxID=2109942 RepID=A0A2T1KQM3_9GAMM|nr:DUF6776 family protein [Marinobacter fuscus]PSF12405.1 hypothetical protein C7H09_04055 [Marinobacter fuscus]
MSESSRPAGEYVVVRRQPGQGFKRGLLLVFCIAVAAAAGYAGGLAQGGFQLTREEAAADPRSEELETLRAQYRETRQELVNLERGRAVDEQALKAARYNIVELETRISELEADLTFYRNIMAPSETSKGLQVDSFTLVPRRHNGEYGFKMVLTQVGNNKNYITGLVAVNVIGSLDGEKEVIALRDLSEEIDDLGVKFRFRYFQDVEGSLRLPQGFEPFEIQVVAQAQGRKASQAERTFDWKALTES